VLQCVAVCCSVVQCVAACCSVFLLKVSEVELVRNESYWPEKFNMFTTRFVDLSRKEWDKGFLGRL